MSLVFIAQRGAAAAKAETGSEVSEEDVVLERPDSDNVVALNVQAILGGGEPEKSPLRAFKAALDDSSDAGSFKTQRPRVRLLRKARDGRVLALKALNAKKAVGISDRRPELILSNELQR
ncbi:MAG: hypothetical protein OXC60_01390 [Litoreibacter sp.]|nr:hypothetical protein [Litoreibacter sp.]MCY4333315.1 hypothetical protein [Litoreibacter sp.]